MIHKIQKEEVWNKPIKGLIMDMSSNENKNNNDNHIRFQEKNGPSDKQTHITVCIKMARFPLQWDHLISTHINTNSRI